jgi:TonB family protein
MKSLTLCALFLAAIVNHSFSQKTKKITKNSGEKYNNTTDVFYVLADDETVKHGNFRITSGGKKVIEGYYNMDKKDSVWKCFGRTGKLLSEKIYVQGEKKGVWSFYTSDGKPEWQYDFENKTGTNEKAKPLSYAYQNENGDWVKEKADVDPKWLVSNDEWQSFLNRTLRYPQDALDTEAQGTPLIEITIDENGNVVNYAVSKSVHRALDEEALRVVKAFQPEFVPAEKNGKRVKTKVELPIVFRIEIG